MNAPNTTTVHTEFIATKTMLKFIFVAPIWLLETFRHRKWVIEKWSLHYGLPIVLWTYWIGHVNVYSQTSECNSPNLLPLSIYKNSHPRERFVLRSSTHLLFYYLFLLLKCSQLALANIIIFPSYDLLKWCYANMKAIVPNRWSWLLCFAGYPLIS